MILILFKESKIEIFLNLNKLSILSFQIKLEIAF